MLRPKKNRRLIANETKPISVINSGDNTLKVSTYSTNVERVLNQTYTRAN